MTPIDFHDYGPSHRLSALRREAAAVRRRIAWHVCLGCALAAARRADPVHGGEGVAMKLFWAPVWARIVHHRIKDTTWQATFTIPAEFEHNRCFNISYMAGVRLDENAAYDVFNTDFRHLRPDIQIALSGATLKAWNERDMARRYPVEAQP